MIRNNNKEVKQKLNWRVNKALEQADNYQFMQKSQPIRTHNPKYLANKEPY